jgi:hypothetical protein
MARTREKEDILRRANEYARRYGRTLGAEIGFGVHGTVFVIENQPESGEIESAIKVHERVEPYHRERDVYLRLQKHGVIDIRGCRVPRLLRFDDELSVIEMSVVTRPFVLDFAGAHLDKPPEFSEEVMADWLADKQEQFGSRWPEVQAILRALQTFGIHMEDVTPGNISFAE